MLFNSFPFIFIFFPITVLIYFLLSKSKNSFLQLMWLAGSSFLFYAYWKKTYLILLLGSVCVNFAFAQYIMQDKNKFIFILGLIFNIAVLFYFKYTAFFIHNIAKLTGFHLSIPNIALPLGISFITFQKIAYLVDVYRGNVKETHFLNYLVFISFFPQLIAGPIVHYNQLMPQFSNIRTKRFNYKNFNIGMTLFVIGLAKKVILADNAALYSDPVFAAMNKGIALTFQETWVGVLAYTFQIYFDFSGYSDMAIGLARILGIRLPLNFNSPYKSFNIIEFWRRWHMTLSRFLRDYIYIPLGGNRQGIVRKHTNLMITMLIGGLWHGANWTFVIWGGLHGLYLMVNHLWVSICNTLAWSRMTHSFIYKLIATLFTFFLVTLAWVFFRSANMATAKTAFHGLFGFHGFGIPKTSYLHQMPFINMVNSILPITPSPVMTALASLLYLVFMLVIIWLLPNSQELVRIIRKPGLSLKLLAWKPNFVHLTLTMCLLYTSLGFMCDFDIKPFEYFAF